MAAMEESDAFLIAEAERLFDKDDSLLAAAAMLQQLQDPSKIDHAEHLQQILRMAELMTASQDEMLSDPTESGWKKQSESHGDRHFLVYYKILDTGAIQCRIDSPVESSLYVPFLAVLNEPDLYQTWIPYWKFPFRVGVSKSAKLCQRGRVQQVIQIQNDFPWPFAKREVVMWGFGDDDSARSRRVGVKLKSLQTSEEDPVVPPAEPNVVRMDLDGGLLFRPCPPNHPALAKKAGKSRRKASSSSSTSHTQQGEEQQLVLLSFVMTLDPKLEYIPQKFLNFCTRTVIGTVWRMMLHVAEEVRDGKRPEFVELLEAKRDLYGWMEERAQVVAHGRANGATASGEDMQPVRSEDQVPMPKQENDGAKEEQDGKAAPARV